MRRALPLLLTSGLALLMTHCTAVTCKDCAEITGQNGDFDVDARIADIEANGGVHTILTSTVGEIFLEISDPASPLFGAAVSIPATALDGVPRSLLSIEPYDGSALSLGLGQTEVGPKLSIRMIAVGSGDPISLARSEATVFAPFALTAAANEVSEAGVFLGTQLEGFSTALTSVAGRRLFSDPDLVSGLVGRFGTFVAFHAEIDDTPKPPEEEEDDDLPEDPSSQSYSYEVEPSCNVQATLGGAPLSRSLSYEWINVANGLARFSFTAADAFTDVIDYEIETSGPALAPPTLVDVDPGFPTGIYRYAFKLGCEKGLPAPGIEVVNAHNSVTEPAVLTVNGVAERNVTISDWFTTSVEPTTCGGDEAPCEVHTGFVRVRFSSLMISDQTNPLNDAEFSIDTWFGNALWEVPD